MIGKDRLFELTSEARGVSRAIGRAMRRPATYPGAVKEVLFTGINIALYPAGLIGEAAGIDPGTGSLRGRFSPQLALRYLDPEAASTPIILVHGYFHNRSAFLMMRRQLRRMGYRHVDTLNYNVIGSTIDDLAQRLARHVDEILECTGANQVHLVGHSLGGLISRLYIQQYGGDQVVHTCVTLGTPHNGTYTAYVGRGPAARDIRPGSELLTRLDATARETPVRFVSYYTNLDALVIPASSAKITAPALKATNILIKDLGHLSLLISSPLIHSIGVTLSRLDGVVAVAPEQEATVTAIPAPKRRRTRSAGSKAGGTA